MLGFGELVANEAAWRLGWSGTKVRVVIDRKMAREHGRRGANMVMIDFSYPSCGFETCGAWGRDEG
jgi:hypothetical protein